MLLATAPLMLKGNSLLHVTAPLQIRSKRFAFMLNMTVSGFSTPIVPIIDETNYPSTTFHFDISPTDRIAPLTTGSWQIPHHLTAAKAHRQT